MNIIEINGVTKRFVKDKNLSEFILRPFQKDVIIALDNINLKVKKGELFGLLGTNGAGKTTLLKLMATLLISDSGKVRIKGYETSQNENKVKNIIGYVNSDERSFFWRLTARENLEFFASLYGLKGLNLKKKVEDALRIVNLLEKADTRFDGFSTGMKHSLSIARGLLSNPEIMLIDELSSGIDPSHAYDLRIFVKQKLSKRLGKTVVITTHNMTEAEEMCDRIAIIDKGQIKAIGTVKEIKRQFKAKNLEQAFRRATC